MTRFDRIPFVVFPILWLFTLILTYVWAFMMMM